jgi:hypothetical protein
VAPHPTLRMTELIDLLDLGQANRSMAPESAD